MVDELYSSAKDMSDVINQNFLENLFREKTLIKVIIIRNPELCNQLRPTLMNYFKDGKS